MNSDRWGATWRALGVEQPDDRLYRQIIERYSEPHRHYHTLQHLEECFARLDEASETAERIHEIELALWFHDAVYDVRRSDNEERSARWALDAARAAGVAEDAARRVHDLILATRHDVLPDTKDAALLVDVDLAVLGAPRERFDEYERQVREEYAWVPGFLFRRRRREILESFLNRPSVYATPHFRARYEEQARDNLRRALAKLGPR